MNRHHVILVFDVTFDAMEARYVKIIAKNIKACPQWHPGAGGKAWIFVDEVLIG